METHVQGVQQGIQRLNDDAVVHTGTDQTSTVLTDHAGSRRAYQPTTDRPTGDSSNEHSRVTAELMRPRCRIPPMPRRPPAQSRDVRRHMAAALPGRPDRRSMRWRSAVVGPPIAPAESGPIRFGRYPGIFNARRRPAERPAPRIRGSVECRLIGCRSSAARRGDWPPTPPLLLLLLLPALGKGRRECRSPCFCVYCHRLPFLLPAGRHKSFLAGPRMCLLA